MQTFLARDVVVFERGKTPSLDPVTLNAVDDRWASAIASHPELVDGWLFSVKRVQLPEIVGVFVRYRWFVAQYAQPALYERLGVAPLAITGRVVTSDHRLVFGLRSEHSTQDPGRWELAPAGGIDPSARTAAGTIEPVAIVRRELEEELGVQAFELVNVTCVGLVIDPASHVHDLVYDIAITLSAEQLRQRSTTLPDAEHDAFEYLAIDSAPGALQPSELAAATPAILELPFARMDCA